LVWYIRLQKDKARRQGRDLFGGLQDRLDAENIVPKVKRRDKEVK
jgi:hypothetical protein